MVYYTQSTYLTKYVKAKVFTKMKNLQKNHTYLSLFPIFKTKFEYDEGDLAYRVFVHHKKGNVRAGATGAVAPIVGAK